MTGRSGVILVAAVLLGVSGAAALGAARAGAASATAAVRVTVAPQVSVGAVSPPAGVGNVPVGEFPATVTLRVRSTAAHVSLHVVASSQGDGAGAVGVEVNRVDVLDGGGEDVYATVTWRRDDSARAVGPDRRRVALVTLAMPQ